LAAARSAGAAGILGGAGGGRGNRWRGGAILLSRTAYFNLKSSSFTSTFSPSFGIGSFRVHSTPCATSRGYASCFQLLWKCRPLKPKDRPPSGRSQAQATVSY